MAAPQGEKEGRGEGEGVASRVESSSRRFSLADVEDPLAALLGKESKIMYQEGGDRNAQYI